MNGGAAAGSAEATANREEADARSSCGPLFVRRVAVIGRRSKSSRCSRGTRSPSSKRRARRRPGYCPIRVELDGKPPRFAFGVNAPQTPPRRLPRREEAPRRMPRRLRVRVGRGGQRSFGDASPCDDHGNCGNWPSRGLSRESPARSRGRTSSSAITSSAGAASAFDLLARGISTGGCDLCVRTRRATGCGSRRLVILFFARGCIFFATRKPPDWHDSDDVCECLLWHENGRRAASSFDSRSRETTVTQSPDS